MLKTWMCAAVRQQYATDVRTSSFKASPGWVNDFKARHSIVTRRRTNKKVASVAERLPKIKSFHKTLQAFVSGPGGDDDPTFGLYKPSSVFNVDQSPLALQPRVEHHA